MARHRNIRNLRIEDELDEEEDVDYYDEEEDADTPLSPDSSQYIYQRAPLAGQRQQASAQPHQEDEFENPNRMNFPKQEANKVTAKVQKQKVPPVQPMVENLRLSETANARSSSKSPSRASGKTIASNMEIALNTTPIYRKRVRPEGTTRSLTLVIVGHVDAGKSTLIGHLLYLLGNVDERVLHKHRQESSRLGKASFAFAWILDESEEERNRGVTMDIARVSFESPSGRIFNVLDAPGHKDFIPNMISGASQADVALLVVNATRGEFETGFDQGGQTREHALLIRALGVSRLVIAINKLDTVDWSKDRYDELCAILNAFLLRRAGFESVLFIPVSGLLGFNLTKRPSKEHPLASWYQGQTLIEALDSFALPNRSDDEQLLRIVVNDMLRYSPQTLVLSAKVESGSVEASERLWLMPEANPVTIKAISFDNTSFIAGVQPKSSSTDEQAFAGDHITLTVTGSFEPDTVFPGHLLCRGGKELLMPSRHFRARIVTFDIRRPILKGTQAELFCHSLRVPCVICHLRAVHPGAKEMEKKNPRFLPRNVPALVDIQTEVPINVEPFSQTKSLGRLALRANGETIAAGIVEECTYAGLVK